MVVTSVAALMDMFEHQKDTSGAFVQSSANPFKLIQEVEWK